MFSCDEQMNLVFFMLSQHNRHIYLCPQHVVCVSVCALFMTFYQPVWPTELNLKLKVCRQSRTVASLLNIFSCSDLGLTCERRQRAVTEWGPVIILNVLLVIPHINNALAAKRRKSHCFFSPVIAQAVTCHMWSMSLFPSFPPNKQVFFLFECSNPPLFLVSP